METKNDTDQKELIKGFENKQEEKKPALSTKTLITLLAALFAFLAVLYMLTGFVGRLRDTGGHDLPVYEVEKDLMQVTVTAGGTLQAMRSHEVKSEVEGSTQILEVIPEGTIITEQDVENGAVLMVLDASRARENLEQQEITVQDSGASYTQAKEEHTIQKEQNESDISQAELRVRFALMELKRYLGDELAERAIDGEIDFESPEWQNDIGGAALQERRRLENSVSLADEELSRTRESLHWTLELVERGYVNRNELVADELQKKRRVVELASAEEYLELFIRYTLIKEAEERLSDYVEAKRNLERTRARARARLSQAEANLRSRRSSYQLQQERLERLHAMIESSTVRATRPGMVVYASTTNPRQFRDSPVQEGLTVREGQTIISMPDLSTLAARVEVPETQAQMVRAGQNAEITVDAMPDKNWQGRVERISPMATQQWGLRAITGGTAGYETDVAFSGLSNESTEIKPGMSATAEIEIARIPEALSIPIHAVHTRDGRRMCWVPGQEGPELREVELGFFTDTHVQIRRGLNEGESVYLAQPERTPRHIRIVRLPEGDSKEDTPNLDPFSPGGISMEEKNDEAHLSELMESFDPETRERLEQRMQDPETRSRIMERLSDPETRQQVIDRMQDPEAGQRQRDGRGRQ